MWRKENNMKLKRILSGIIGFPIVALIFIYANTYIIDAFIGLIAIIAMYEYLKCLSVDYKPVQWIAYVPCLIIPFLHVIPKEYLLTAIGILLTLIVALLFMKVIVSNMKTGISDIAVTILGICYIVFFLSFIAMLHGTEKGKYLIWYIFISAWGTDTFAYLVGMKFGKHKFSKISPKKSIEGCIAGLIGGVALSLLYTLCIDKFAGFQISYVKVLIISVVLTILGQFGDFSASSIKRFVGIKDFSNLIPGHGGLLDRIDSLIFIAPFAYILLTMF